MFRLLRAARKPESPKSPEAGESRKVVVFLGNPGAEYATTRHNVAWWLADELAADWGFGRYRRRGNAQAAEQVLDGRLVQLIKPLTYMNRSGTVLTPLRDMPDFSIEGDLLVVVDDVSLEPGIARYRAKGSAGGHNGLKSIEEQLGTREYARLRIGVGSAPPGEDLVDWVLSTPDAADRAAIREQFPELIRGIRVWLDDGIDEVMNRFNSQKPNTRDGEKS